jgi:hypothetical protein
MTEDYSMRSRQHHSERPPRLDAKTHIKVEGFNLADRKVLAID